ncbi:DENN domain-containing protein 3-like [Pecten maximus]|uniref:DENN domain-containing protein 3-like n=1 Tax=Pecten maximus TaxID=6579 RepID=UPI00145861C8|nr:DENN domain-containing protein 3-like [Pecten maximus]
MWAGKVISEATKDIAVVQQAAQNVLLVDTIIRSGEEEGSSHHATVENSADHLCCYIRAMVRGEHLLSSFTREALQKKLDPNFGEPERTSILALLYTPGDAETHLSPKLWCGLVNGKVRVFDGIMWTLEKEFVQAKKSLSCLTAVGRKQVWVGSYEICIIETETIQSKRILSDHGEFVIDIIAVDDSRYVYSASVNGVIIRWYVKGLTVANRIALDMSAGETLRSLQHAQGYLWCGVWKGIWKINKSGEILAKLSFDIPRSAVSVNPVEMECFHIMENGQIWAGCRRDGTIVVMDTKNGGKIMGEPIKLEAKGISIMVKLKNRMWIGTKSGIMYVVDIETRAKIKDLKAHYDAVRALCCADDRYVISGAGSSDGKIIIWSPTDSRSASGRFLLE